MSDLNKLWIVEDESQEPVEFNEPTPPPCGFHSISPAQFDFQVPGAVPGNLWTPNLGRAQPVPATPPDHSDRTGTWAGGSGMAGLQFFGGSCQCMVLPSS